MLCVTTLHAPIQQQTCILPSLPLTYLILVVATDIPHEIQLQVGFVFPDFVSASSDSVSPFCLGYLSVLLPSVCFLTMFQFSQKLLIPPRPQNFCLTFLLGWTALELGAGDF